MNIGIYAYGVRNKETLHSQSSLQLIYFSSVMIFIISSNNVQIFDHFAHLPILPMSSRTSSNFSMTSSNSSSFLSVLWDCSESWFKCSVAMLSISLSIFFFSEFFCRDNFSIFSSHFFLGSLFLVILQFEYWSSLSVHFQLMVQNSCNKAHDWKCFYSLNFCLFDWQNLLQTVS